MNAGEKSLLKALDQGGIVALVDQYGNYIYVNRRWEEDTGMTSDQVLGKNVEDVVSGSAAMLSLRTGRVISGEMFLRSKAGRELSSIMKYQPVFDEEKNVSGCLITSLFSRLEEAQDFSKKLDQILKEFQYLKSPERGSSGAKYSVQSIIGDSPGMRDVREQIYIAGATAASCLIEGETGTGKELVAHAIHNVSMRKIFPFVKVNCSAIPENLMESELFGYEEGSFTGGVKGGKAGKFEKAHLGSMFLDEINAMSLKMQPKLLRALQEKEIERVGGTESIPVNVRVLSASNMPLDYLVEQGVFRRDLFYRLNIITVKIPPLRRRKEDILPLTQSFIKRYNSELCRNVSGISDGALQYLTEYDWPGNVRELQNVIERVMASTWEDRLDVEVFRRFSPHLSAAQRTAIPSAPAALEEKPETAVKTKSVRTPAEESTAQAGESLRDADASTEILSLSRQKEASEKEAILRALQISGMNKSKAARMLNISRTLLYKKLEKYDITC